MNEQEKQTLALNDILRQLEVANGQLARLLAHLEVPPAPARRIGGVLDVLEQAPPGTRNTDADGDTPPTD